MYCKYTDRIMCLARQISGDRIKEMATAIYGFDRWFRFPDFHKSAAYCRQKLREAKMDRVEHLHFPADGKTRFYDYIMPIGWDARKATLIVIPPTGEPMLLASYEQCPISLFNYSAPTPPEGITAEIVYARNERHLETLELKNKIVFVHDQVSRCMEQIIARKGGRGVITDWAHFNILSSAGVKWENYAFFPNNPFKLFGFSIRPEDGRRLKTWLKTASRKGQKVVAQARVDTRLYQDQTDLVIGTIRGRTDEEIIGYSHLFEFGAWDNAAGCAIQLEVAALLQRLIQSGALPKPRRTIKFIFGWECYGSICYLAVHRHHERIIAGINMDGHGLDMRQFNTPLLHFKNPDSNPSFVDFFLGAILKEALPLSNTESAGAQNAAKQWKTRDIFPKDDFFLTWKSAPLFGGCDSLWADPYFNVPFPALVQFNKAIWHNEIDTPDKLTSDVLARVAMIEAMYLYGLAAAGWNETRSIVGSMALDSEDLLRRTLRRMIDQLQRESAGKKCRLSAILKQAAAFQSRITYLCRREQARVASLAKIVPSKHASAFEQLRQSYQQRLEQLLTEGIRELSETIETVSPGRCLAQDHQPRLSSLEKKAQCLVPVRNIPGILTLETLPVKVRYNKQWRPAYQALVAPILWTDGQRSLYEIARLVEQETGRCDLAELTACFEFLAKHGYVTLNRPENQK